MSLYGSYIFLNIVASFSLSNYMREHSISHLPAMSSGFEIPVSIIVPAYNEEATIVSSVHALLQLNYPQLEIIVINDGSTDSTLQTLIDEFAMVPFAEAYRIRIQTKPIRGVYLSSRHSNLRVIDKHNGGKADALNAGINTARYPLFCGVDADSVLQTDSIEHVVQPFLLDHNVVAAGGTVRIANGCEFNNGFLQKAGLPKNPLALIQVTEYLRAFLFGRLGWSPMNAVLIISGAFGIFRKETVVDMGGYRTDTIGEDMELVVRIHKTLRKNKKKYRIVFVPDPVCWTEAPEDFTTLKNQRVRWQQGLSESLMMNRELLFSRNGGAPGWIAFPYMLIFEWLGPLIEVLGFCFIFIGLYFGFVDNTMAVAFFLIAVGFGVLTSVIALLLEELSFHVYPKFTSILKLFFAAIIENFGYRQISAVWRVIGFTKWVFGKKHHWGEMKRSGKWQN